MQSFKESTIPDVRASSFKKKKKARRLAIKEQDDIQNVSSFVKFWPDHCAHNGMVDTPSSRRRMRTGLAWVVFVVRGCARKFKLASGAVVGWLGSGVVVAP